MNIRNAIETGDISGLAKLISEGAAVEPALLIDAAMGRGGSRLSIVRALLNAGADPNYSNGCTTPLETACSSSNADVVQALLEAGAKTNIGSPVHSAVEGGNVEALQHLSSAGALMNEPLDGDPDELGDIHGLTPSQYAEFLGRTKCMMALECLQSGELDTVQRDASVTTSLARIRAVAEQALQSGPPGVGVDAAEISDLESDLGLDFPADLREMLQIFNGYQGVIPFDGYNATLGRIDEDEALYNFLTTADVKQACDAWRGLLASGDFADRASDPQPGIQDAWWHRGWLPFASNGEGDFLCVDTAPTSEGNVGQVIAVSHESKDRVMLAGSLAEWLADLADHLELLAERR